MSHDDVGNEPVHLNNHHIDTLTSIFAHPTGHNIRWPDVVSLIGTVGSIEEKHDGKFRVSIGHEVEVFTRPKHKDIDTQQVIDLRRMLTNAGFTPQQPGKEV